MSTQPLGKTALITGASSGIGLDFARLFAEKGHDVVLVARSQERLATLAQELSGQHGVRALPVKADLSDPAAPKQLMERLEAEGVRVDALINNAGYASYGPFAETDLDTELKMIQLNITALTALTKAVLPGMLARHGGRILNVASTAAFQPGPLMAVYYATKAYVLSFSEALADEVEGSGVTVTCLCPGPTQTGFQARARMETSRLVSGKRIMDSSTVALAGYRGLHQGRRLVIPGLKNKVLAQSARVLPRRTLTALVHRAQARVQE
jgi:uncharacterized protein